MAAELTVTELPTTIGPNGDWVVFELGRANWSPAWIPDPTTADGTLAVDEDERLDIVVLCDGYTSKATFAADLSTWLINLFQLEVFDWFRGAVRIRAVYTPSAEKASARRDSFYRVKVTDSEKGIAFGSWPNTTGADDVHFRETVWAVLSALGVNAAAYPTSLDAEDPLLLNNTFSHLTVGMLVRAANDNTPSGRALTAGPVGPAGERLKLGVGNNWIHELCHAFAYLADEYIEQRGVATSSTNPDQPSLYNITNKCFADTAEHCWWTHLSPLGDFPRPNPQHEPSAVVGWLWRGAYNELGVWHAEYMCLMNGTHNNYCHVPDPATDTLADGVDGANLRVRYRFCMWCQELVAMRFLEKTGVLRQSDDGSAVTAELGRSYLNRWRQTWRQRYYGRFNIQLQLEEREASYATQSPPADCAGSPPLQLSGLYMVQRAFAAKPSLPVPYEVATWLPVLG